MIETMWIAEKLKYDIDAQNSKTSQLLTTLFLITYALDRVLFYPFSNNKQYDDKLAGN